MHQIEAPATIVAVLAHGAYRAALANGHECIARAAKDAGAGHQPGERVLLAFSPADLSRARIVPESPEPKVTPQVASSSVPSHKSSSVSRNS